MWQCRHCDDSIEHKCNALSVAMPLKKRYVTIALERVYMLVAQIHSLEGSR